MKRRFLPVALIALLLPALPPSSTAGQNPLEPLTKVAQHLQDGFAAFLAGKPASEAFAPWACDNEAAERARAALKEAKVASAKPLAAALEMRFLQDGQAKTSMIVEMWLAGSSPSVMTFERGLQIGDPTEDTVALEDLKGPTLPFGEAAKGLRALLVGEAWKGLPVTPKAEIEALLPEGPVREEALQQMANVLQDAESYTKEIAEAKDATLRVGVGDLKLTLYDAEGNLVGMLPWRVTVTPEGLSLKPRRLRPVPK